MVGERLDLAAHAGGETAGRAARLAHAGEGAPEELGQEADGPHPQARDRCKRHGRRMGVVGGGGVAGATTQLSNRGFNLRSVLTRPTKKF